MVSSLIWIESALNSCVPPTKRRIESGINKIKGGKMELKLTVILLLFSFRQ